MKRFFVSKETECPCSRAIIHASSSVMLWLHGSEHFNTFQGKRVHGSHSDDTVMVQLVFENFDHGWLECEEMTMYDLHIIFVTVAHDPHSPRRLFDLQ